MEGVHRMRALMFITLYIILHTMAPNLVKEKAEDNPTMSIQMVGNLGHALVYTFVLLSINAKLHYAILLYEHAEKLNSS